MIFLPPEDPHDSLLLTQVLQSFIKTLQSTSVHGIYLWSCDSSTGTLHSRHINLSEAS